MLNPIIVVNLISLLFQTSTNVSEKVTEHLSQEDLSIIEANSIADRSSYDKYLSKTNRKKESDSGLSISSAVLNPYQWLKLDYLDYRWALDKENSASTSDVSNAVPIEMKNQSSFPDEDIKKAIVLAGVEDKTNYGGCGPIAEIGVLDYFARYLNYNEIIDDPTNADKRVGLAKDVFSNTHFSFFGNKSETLVWPWDARNAFNQTIQEKGLENKIVANDTWSLFGGKKDDYWKTIVENIDEGIPVTLFTGKECGDGDFAEHYTNIYGYETWVGFKDGGKERLTKRFIKARLNQARGEDTYCDADILDCAQVGLITYKVNYENSYNFYASDFAKDFVNENGGGQYFYSPKETNVTLSNGMKIDTERLRTSYIENQYLVMSPNREDAGSAYLDIAFPHNVSRLAFDSSMWSSKEGAERENFEIQYFKDNHWEKQKSIDANKLSISKKYPDNFVTLFPKNTNRIRFFSSHSNPIADRNKGRICLDNFQVSYH